MLNGTSNEYDLQSVYTANRFLGVITELSQIFLAIYDTTISPYSYTGSENIDITDNIISLECPLKVNDEIVLHPIHYDGAVFEMISGTDVCFSTNFNSWWSADRTILFIEKSMYFLWRL